MNNILEMIKNERVEWKKLETLIDYEQPTKYIVKSTEYDDRFDTPVLTAGQTFILGFTDELENIYKADENNPVIIFDDFTAGNHWVDFNFKVKSSAMKILKPKEGVNFRYCYHYLKTIHIDISEHKRLWLSKFSKIEIPIPSLETQERIVKTLDTMMDHFTQLQAELQARNRQYEHYRDKLLSEEYLNKLTENNNVRKTRLCEIAQLNRGKRVVRNQLSQEGLYPVFQNSLIPLGFYDNKNFNGEKTCIITAGAAGDIFYQEKDFWAADDVFVITTDETIDKYLYYFILNKQFILKSKVRRASVPRLSRESIEGLEILVPPIPVQEHVVSILDNFNKIVSDINEGLPKEIELRQKQYEYYRERLLDFKREED